MLYDLTKYLTMRPLERGFIVLIAFLTLAACPKTMQHNVIYLTENDSGKKLIISRGREIILTLPNRVDGGYRFDKELYDPSILKLEKHTEKPAAARSPLGAPGESTWQFRAIAGGQTPLKITASRPWKGGGTVVMFEDSIAVKQ
jgi:predicted secreted protein